MSQNLTASLIRSLGYCCEFSFWQFFADKPSALVADRLGVSPRSVQRHRAKCPPCEHSARCMAARIPLKRG